MAAIALISGAFGLMEADMRQAALDYQSRLIASGRNIYKVQAQDEDGNGLLSASACLRLNTVSGVKASAGFRGGEQGFLDVSLAKAPGEFISYRGSVGDIAPILDPSSVSRFDEGFFIDTALAAKLGISDGSQVALTIADQPQTVTAHIVDASARNLNESQVLWGIADPSVPLSECLVELEPGAQSDAAREWISAAFDDGHTIIAVTPFTQESGNAVPPLEQYRVRVSRFFWAVSGVACFVLLLVFMMFRRHEFALYRSVGAGKNPTSLIFIIANGVLLAIGHLAGACWMTLIVQWTRRQWPADPRLMTATVGASFALSLALITIGAAIISRGNMAAYIQKRL